MGDVQITEIVDPQGQILHPEHVVQPGHVVCIRCEDTSASSDISQLRVSYAPSDDSDHVMAEGPPAWMEDSTTAECEISPTAIWSQPVEEPSGVDQPKVPLGEQGRQHAFDHAAIVNQSWISAAPLLDLKGNSSFGSLPQ